MSNGFLYSSELVSLGIAVFFVFFMLYSKPRRTYIYLLDFFGMIMSIVLIMVEAYFGSIIDNPAKNYNPISFKISATLFVIIYMVILNMIMMYVSKLAINRRNVKSKITYTNGIFAIAYFGFSLFYIWSGSFYDYKDGVIELHDFVHLIFGLGALASIVCLISTIKNFESFSKTVYRYILLFLPVDLIIIVIQLIFDEHIFASITYVLPLVLFYVIFHSNPYDDYTGFQNEFSFETRLFEESFTKSDYSIIYVTLPLFNKVDYNFIMDDEKYLLYGRTCRRIEYAAKKVYIYKLSHNSFAIIHYRKHNESSNSLVWKVQDILTEVCQLVDPNFYFRLIAVDRNKFIKNMDMQKSMWKYLLNKMDKSSGNQIYIAEEQDYEDWNKQYEIERMLIDLRNKKDLDDDRVICYVQPIYNVEEKRFKTAEALMRMQMDGKMIFPDQFIPLAEKNGCIHVLTLIILNKVCAKIKEFEDHYDFDSISINCSSAEFSGKDIDKELLEIIYSHRISPSKISIELTESAMFDSFDLVLDNIHKLTDVGVKFYLDDFGTGYSNLERIINCPFSTIKFDKSLLYKSIDDSSMKELVTEMVQIFKKKGFVALVEGVEDDEQSAFAVDRGFEFIQGYRYAKPLPIDGLKDYLNKR